jgi:hypothetical protein
MSLRVKCHSIVENVIYVNYGKSERGLTFRSLYFFLNLINLFFIHMCIQCLGHFFPPSPPPLLPLTPRYPAETILSLYLVLLKREYKQ